MIKLTKIVTILLRMQGLKKKDRYTQSVRIQKRMTTHNGSEETKCLTTQRGTFMYMTDHKLPITDHPLPITHYRSRYFQIPMKGRNKQP